MEISQGQIIQKPNKQEFSSFFMTHRLNVMHAPKFHKYIPYSLGVMARTRMGMDICTGRTGVTLNALPLFFYMELSQGQIIQQELCQAGHYTPVASKKM